MSPPPDPPPDARLGHQFVTLLERTSDFIFFKDRESRFIFCSQSLAELCGYSDWRELVGKSDADLFPPEIARKHLQEDAEIVRDGTGCQNMVKPYVDHRGNTRWVITCKWPVFEADSGRVVSICGISRDITREKHALDALQEHVLRSEALLRSAADGIHVLDMKGNVREVNDAFCQMLGYTREEALKLNVAQWDAHWSEAELLTERLPSAYETRQVFETRHRRKNGRVIDVEVSAAGIEIAGERLVFASSRDISERKRSERELKRLAAELLEADRMKDVFTDVLRHDILNPAGAIKNVTDILLSRESEAWKLDALRRLRQAADNLIEMTQNAARLASLASSGGLEFIEMDTRAVLQTVVPDFEHKLEEKHLTLTDRSDASVHASVHPIVKEAFVNLISNAIKYSPSGSSIEVGVEDHGESWLAYVKDQGPGVPDAHKQTIFNRFERLRKDGVRGSGLGLTITRQVAILHGGQVWVEDNPSGGSVFILKLPKSPASQRSDTTVY